MASFLADHLVDLELEDVACLLRVSERQVRNYINDEDLPCTGEGAKRRFTWDEVLAWRDRYQAKIRGSRGSEGRPALPLEGVTQPSETIAQATLRKLKGEADLIELKLARERREVVAIADAKNAMAKIASSLRTQILAMPAKLTGQLFGVKERERIRAILEREADAQCRRLAALGNASPDEVAQDE